MVAMLARALAAETGLAGVSLRCGHVAPGLTARQREVLLLWCDGSSAHGKPLALALCDRGWPCGTLLEGVRFWQAGTPRRRVVPTSKTLSEEGFLDPGKA